MIKVEVTQRHIDKGQRNSPFTCPIALAIDEYNDGNDAVVFSDRIYMTLGELFNDKKYDPSPELQDWMRRFDIGTPPHVKYKKVEPITMVLDTDERTAGIQ